MKTSTLGYIALAALIVGGLGVRWGWMTVSTAHVETIVSRVDRECSGGTNGECKYMVYTPDEVFRNVDCTICLKWNSSDVQNHLIAGHKYDLTVYGWRVPFMSWYRNILTAEEVQ
jgi:hypothetical protein